MDASAESSGYTTISASGSDSGQGNSQSSNQNSVSTEENQDVVQYKTYMKTLDEAKRAKEENRSLKEKLEAFSQDEKRRQEDELKKAKKFDQVLAMKEKEIAETKAKIQSYEQQFTDSKKISAFFDALGGARIEDKYMVHIDPDRIIINEETGEVDKTSVMSYAEEFKKEYARVLDVPGRNPGLPSAEPKSSDPLSLEQWKSLPLKDRKQKMAAVYNNVVNKS